VKSTSPQSYSPLANGLADSAPTRRPSVAVDAHVHLLDADAAFRRVVTQQLAEHGKAVVPYASADQFLDSYEPRDVECLIVDMGLPGMSAVDLVQHLRSRYVISPIIVVSDFAGTADIVQAIQRGASDFLEKPIPEHVLVHKVEAAVAKDRDAKIRRGNIESRLNRLTEREREVMELLIAAKTTIEAAHRLGISPKTVEKHRVRVFDKLNVASVPALIRLVCNLQDEEAGKY
jgi:two-component system response regulator FixJ